MNAPLAVVLAAGKGTRMKSDRPKVLIEVLGRPMIEYVLDALDAAGVAEVVAVVGYRADFVRETLAARQGLSFVDQTEQLGTGHAVRMALPFIAKRQGPVIVLAGDSPLVQPTSLRKLLAEYAKGGRSCLLGTIHKANPTGLGRIVRNAAGEFQGIVEERDATPEQRRITEVNLSCYVFHAPDLAAALDRIRPTNAQGEYYLTDAPAILMEMGKSVVALPILEPIEALSINTPQELAEVETALRDKATP